MVAKTKKGAPPNFRGHFGVIVADPAWRFEDQLTMSEVKRGSSSQYGTLSMEAVKGLRVSEVAAPDALLALWVPSALLQDGLDVMRAWGFKHKQVYTWGKTAQHLTDKSGKKGRIVERVREYADNGLAFGMGHYFRGCTEHALIGVRGRIGKEVENHSQRNLELSLELAPALKHSAKPDGLQERLERMFPDLPKLELFARRDREGWVCQGKECPSTYGEDIREWLQARLPAPGEAVA